MSVKSTERVIHGRYALSVGRPEMASAPGWMWIKLTDIARLESGHTPSRVHSDYWDGPIRWVGIADARDHHGTTIYETAQTITETGLANSAARLLPAGTVCLVRTAASIGYVTILGREMATSQDLVDWICSERLDPAFLMHLFIVEKESIKSFGKGSAHKTVYFPEVQAFHVCVPPVSEQRRIVATLEVLQSRSRRARDALGTIPPLIEQFRQSVLVAAFRGDLTVEWRTKNSDVEPAEKLLQRIRTERRERWEEAEFAKMQANRKAPADGRWKQKYEEPVPVDASELPELMDGWTWASLDELLVEFRNGISIKPDADHGVRVLRISAVRPMRVNMSDVRFLSSDQVDVGMYTLRDGDLLFTRYNGNPELVGACGVVRVSDVVTVYPDKLIRARTASNLCSPAYIQIAVNIGISRRTIAGMVKTSAGQVGISGADLRRVPVPVAPPEEQKLLVEITERLLAINSRASMRADEARCQLAELDQAILAKAFRGKLVPQDPSEEPASVLLERSEAGDQPNGQSKRSKRAG